jgi:membrane protein DedA with SNARE-associated domain
MIQTDGLLLLFALLALENAGIPVPGEATLIAASLYAGSTRGIGLPAVVIVATAAIVLGGTIGYWIGRMLGAPLLAHYGRYIWLNEARLKTGRYLFMRHGGKIVFFGRFVVLIRTALTLIAGANRMGFPHFAVVNTLGGFVWVLVVSSSAYLFGHEMRRIAGPAAIVVLVGTLIFLAALILFFRRHEKELEARAEAALPGPLT